MSLLNRITINTEICHGKPCIRGMRWPVEVIIDILSSGMLAEEILSDHRDLKKKIFSPAYNMINSRSPATHYKMLPDEIFV